MRRWRILATWTVVTPRTAPDARTRCDGRRCPLPGHVIPDGARCHEMYDEALALSDPHGLDTRRYACEHCAALAVRA